MNKTVWRLGCLPLGVAFDLTRRDHGTKFWTVRMRRAQERFNKMDLHHVTWKTGDVYIF